MLWLTQLWQALIKDVILTGAGLTLIWTQITARQPNAVLIYAGVALTLPAAAQHIAALLRSGAGGGGQSPPPSSSPGAPSSASSSPGPSARD